MSMVTIEVDFWGRPADSSADVKGADGKPLTVHTVGIDMPGTAGRALVAAIRAGKIAAGYGRDTSANITYADLAQGYAAAAAGARVNGDHAAAEAAEAAARRMRETATIVSTFGSLRASASESADRSRVLTTADLAETYAALGNQWGARMVRVAADLSMDMDGQPTLFDAPADPNPVMMDARRRAGRKAAKKAARFDSATVKRLSAKLPPVHVITYGPTGTPTGRETVSVTNVPAHLGTLPGASPMAAWFAHGPIPAPARKRTAPRPAPAPAEAPAPHAFIALTGTRRCATCDRGRTAKCHATTEAPAPAEAPATTTATTTEAPAPAPTTTERAVSMDVKPTRDNWNGHGQPEALTYYGRNPKAPAATGRIVRVTRHGFNGMTLIDPFGATVDSMGGTAKFWAAPVPAEARHLVTDAPAEAPAPAEAEAPAQVAQVDAPAPAEAPATTEAPADAVAQVATEAPAPAEAPAVDVTDIDRDALALITRATWSVGMVGKSGAREGMHVLTLPAGRLSRDAYLAVSALVDRMGGHWSKQVRGFAFPKSRPCFPNGYTVDGRATAEAWLSSVLAQVGTEAPAPAEAPAQVAQVDAPAPAVGATEAPADAVAQVAEALRAAVRAPGVATWMHVATGHGGLSRRAAWCSHLVGPLGVDYAARRTVPSDELTSGAPITCPACSHLVMCRAAGCITCAAILGACDRDGCELCTDARPAEAEAPAQVAQVDAPAPAEAPATTEAPADAVAQVATEAPAPAVTVKAWMVAAHAPAEAEAPAAPAVSTVTAPNGDSASTVTTWAPAPAEAPAQVAQVDAPAEAPAPAQVATEAPAPAGIPAGARPAMVHVEGRGEVPGFAFSLRPGSTTMQLGKAVRHAKLGAFTVTAPRKSRTVSIVPAAGAEAPADWSPVLARVAEILGDAVAAEAPAQV